MNSRITIHDDSNKPARTAFVVTSARVEHYNDIVEHLIRNEIIRCKDVDKFTPTPEQIAFFRKELVRYMVIRRDIETAQKIHIRKGTILCE